MQLGIMGKIAGVGGVVGLLSVAVIPGGLSQAASHRVLRPPAHFVLKHSAGRLTPLEARFLDKRTMTNNDVSAGAPYTVYTISFKKPAPVSATIAVTDNNGSAAFPAVIFYAGYHAASKKNPFFGDKGLLNGATVGGTSKFAVKAVHGEVQFAVLNGLVGSRSVTITIKDVYTHQLVKEIYRPQLGPAAGFLPTDNGDDTLAPGQTATLQFQAYDAAGDPVTTAGVPAEVFLKAAQASSAIPTGVSLDGANPSASNPLHLKTDKRGLITVTLTNTSDSSLTPYDVIAQLASHNAFYIPDLVTDIPPADEVTSLGLSLTPITDGNPVQALAIPTTITMTVGSTLDASAFGGAAGAPVYLEGVNPSGDAASGVPTNGVAAELKVPITTGDDMAALSANPTVVSVGGWDNETLGETQLQSGVTTLPTLTAKKVGTTKVVLVDVSNPALPLLELNINVVQ